MGQGNDLNCVVDLLMKDGAVTTRQFGVPSAASCIANGTIPVGMGEAESAQMRATGRDGAVVPEGSGTAIKDLGTNEVRTNRLDGASLISRISPSPR